MGGNASKSRERGDVDDCLTQFTSPICDTLNNVTNLPPNSGKRYSTDKALHARWEQYIEGAVSTPGYDRQKSTNQDAPTEIGLKSRNIPETLKPSNRGDELLPTSVTSPLENLLPPKIRLQILSPVHSRVQLRQSAGLSSHDITNSPVQNSGSTCTQGLKRSGDTLLYLKQPCAKSPEESSQEVSSQNELSQHLLEGNLRMRQASMRKSKNQLTIQPTQMVSSHNYKQQIPQQLHPNILQQQNVEPSKIIEPEFHKREDLYTIRPVTRTISKHSVKASISKKPAKTVKILRRTSSHRLTDSRQPSPLSSASKKLKVKGLQNFVNTHRPCPPLWAKQFPCRSRFHPDNYLYDFEGFNAPKRPVAEMERCSKKCGRCNRCGVYVDNICQKCGNYWTQTQKVEVNGHPVIPDKPRLNLHDASSNNPLKVSNNSNSTPEEPKKVLASGYDTYTPIPNHPSPALPSYPAYPGYGCGYPGYLPWPASYPPSYYPAYAPMPPPPPYYGCSQPPVMPPTYNNYPVSHNKTDTNG
ncbi:unnamed protein product [Allacma fusca]|uniref:Uncharacterized protein n=1 Tax=Allacma fusca TaxID=39272 RepID=A0A8J2LHI0_9HEXA|nr:unnamed protein product [Allacma fusca]